MMSGKEALESIRNEYYTENGRKIVVIGNDDERFDIVEKRINVLLLVIRKGIETYWLEHTTNVDEYNKKIANLRETFSLNEEEYKLVKEVFRNDK